MMLKSMKGMRVRTLVDTPRTHWDNMSERGQNYSASKYPAGTEGYVTFCGIVNNVVNIAFGLGTEDLPYNPIYKFNEIEIIKDKN
ncbi:MAG: hypothetical protein IJG09_08390 [Methanobrevibacter sp.]|nr:hypothetical protein [Methanobrevibacter sp.]